MRRPTQGEGDVVRETSYHKPLPHGFIPNGVNKMRHLLIIAAFVIGLTNYLYGLDTFSKKSLNIYLVSTNENGESEIVRLHDGKIAARFPLGHGVVVGYSGNRIFSVGQTDENQVLTIWDSQTGEKLDSRMLTGTPILGYPHTLNGAASYGLWSSPDGKTVFCNILRSDNRNGFYAINRENGLVTKHDIPEHEGKKVRSIIHLEGRTRYIYEDGVEVEFNHHTKEFEKDNSRKTLTNEQSAELKKPGTAILGAGGIGIIRWESDKLFQLTDANFTSLPEPRLLLTGGTAGMLMTCDATLGKTLLINARAAGDDKTKTIIFLVDPDRPEQIVWQKQFDVNFPSSFDVSSDCDWLLFVYKSGNNRTALVYNRATDTIEQKADLSWALHALVIPVFPPQETTTSTAP
jgi:hypothetical protein